MFEEEGAEEFALEQRRLPFLSNEIIDRNSADNGTSQITGQGLWINGTCFWKPVDASEL